MTKKRNIKLEKLTEHITYRIEDSTIYLFLNGNTIKKEELNIVYKMVKIIMEDQDLSYINVSGKHLEENKEFFHELGFVLSYYDVNKLNDLYASKDDKRSYRCYGLMTKNDFINKISDDKKENKEIDIKVTNSNAGYVNSLLLLFGGIALLCYFCINGAIYLVK